MAFIIAVIILLSGCELKTSFLGLYENYKIRIPENCEILKRCAAYIGFDSTSITELQYTEDTISTLFPWQEMDELMTKNVQKVLSCLEEIEEHNKNLPDFDVVGIVSDKLPYLKYYDATPEWGKFCYLLFDPGELILYVCEDGY